MKKFFNQIFYKLSKLSVWQIVFLPIGIFMAIYIFRYVRSFLGSSAMRNIVKDEADKISKSSGDSMANGYTYLSASQWLAGHLFSEGLFSDLKNVDEIMVGNFILSVRADEYQQLATTYSLYKKESQKWYQIGRTKGDLTDDLKSAFNSKEQTTYLAHLPV